MSCFVQCSSISSCRNTKERWQSLLRSLIPEPSRTKPPRKSAMVPVNWIIFLSEVAWFSLLVYLPIALVR